MPTIILEGVDGIGKSTLGQKFEQSGFQLFKSKFGPPRNQEEFKNRFHLFKEFKQNNPYPVFDRHYAISEFVYGSLIRGESLISMTELVRILKDLCPVYLIFLDAGPRDLQAIWNKKYIDENLKKDHKPSDHIKQVELKKKEISRFYRRVMKELSSHFPSFILSRKDTVNPYELINRLKMY